MADTRVYRLVRCIINGLPFMGELESYTPPEVKKTMEDAKGGRFIAGEVAVGVEKLTGSIKLTGATAEVLQAQGVAVEEMVEITVLGSSEDEDKHKQGLRWEHTAEITSIKSGEIKPGKFDHTIEFSCGAYKHTDGTRIIYDIDVKTQKCVIGGVDQLAAHRAFVELPSGDALSAVASGAAQSPYEPSEDPSQGEPN